MKPTTTNRRTQAQDLRAYVYSLDGMTVAQTVHARDHAHALVKLEALRGITANPAQVESLADFTAAREAALEPLGMAAWQRKLTREERRNQFPLVP